jgi:hypothetical protein
MSSRLILAIWLCISRSNSVATRSASEWEKCLRSRIKSRLRSSDCELAASDDVVLGRADVIDSVEPVSFTERNILLPCVTPHWWRVIESCIAFPLNISLCLSTGISISVMTRHLSSCTLVSSLTTVSHSGPFRVFTVILIFALVEDRGLRIRSTSICIRQNLIIVAQYFVNLIWKLW